MNKNYRIFTCFVLIFLFFISSCELIDLFLEDVNEKNNTDSYDSIKVGDLYSDQNIIGEKSVYYKFTPTESGVHEIALTNTTCDLSWILYSDSFRDYRINQCDNVFYSIGDEIDETSALEKGTEYYLEVKNFDTNNGNFYIKITGPGNSFSDGYIYIETDIKYINQSIQEAGILRYKFVINDSAQYRIELSESNSNLDFTLYSDKLENESILTSIEGVADTPYLSKYTEYYLRVSNMDANDGTFSIEINKLFELEVELTNAESENGAEVNAFIYSNADGNSSDIVGVNLGTVSEGVTSFIIETLDLDENPSGIGALFVIGESVYAQILVDSSGNYNGNSHKNTVLKEYVITGENDVITFSLSELTETPIP